LVDEWDIEWEEVEPGTDPEEIIEVEITSDRWYIQYYTANRDPWYRYAMVDIYIYEGGITEYMVGPYGPPDALVEAINNGNNRVEEIHMIGPGTFTIKLTLYQGWEQNVDFYMALYELIT
jgi:hypothetical protein